MDNLRQALIRLAHVVPPMRRHLVPLLREAADTSSTEEGAKRIYERYKEKHPKTRKTPKDFYEAPSKDTGSKKDKGGKKKPLEAVLVGLVQPGEKKLPKLPKQKMKTEKEILASAPDAQEKQLDWLDRGTGLDKTLGTKALLIEKGEFPDYSKPGPVVVIGPVKTKKRSRQKVAADFGGDWSLLTDVVRSTVAVDTVEELQGVMSALRKSGMKLAGQPRNRFAEPLECGYRDMLLKVEYPNGHVGEVQLHLKAILQAKDVGHPHYEVVREIEAKAKEEGRKTFTDEEQKAVDEANAAMKKLYEGAWEKVTGGKKPGGKTAAARAVLFFDFNDIPAKWVYKKFPVKVIKGKEVVEYDLWKFFHGARRISEDAFNKLKAEFDAALNKK